MADVQINHSDGVLAAYLEGEIDHHTASVLREKIDKSICASVPDTLVLDFSAVSFMDSSGIGLILGRHKLIKTLGGSCKVQNAPLNVSKMLRLAGISVSEKGVTI